MELQEFHRDGFSTPTPANDEEIVVKYEVNDVEHYSTSDYPGRAPELFPVNSRNIKHGSINSEQMELNGFNLDLLRCERDCETCQMYIRKLSEHVRATHVSDHPTRDPLDIDPLEMGHSSAVEIKSQMVENVERLDYSEVSESNFEFQINEDSERDPGTSLCSTAKCFKCDQCGKSFTRKDNLTIHMRYHTGEKPYKCEQCDYSFPTKSGLIIHMRSHTGEKPYNCEQCDKSFSTAGYLTIHKRFHTGEKPYTCEQCDKSFATKNQLNRHVICHTGEKPFKCEQCVKSFSTRKNLQVHFRTHTGERPYTCEQCGNCFRTNSSFREHTKRHNGVKPHKCEQCAKCFTTNRELTIHSTSHSGERPYICEHCGKSFTTRSSMMFHRKSHK